jgi:hypothetical protein
MPGYLRARANIFRHRTKCAIPFVMVAYRSPFSRFFKLRGLNHERGPRLEFSARTMGHHSAGHADFLEPHAPFASLFG